MKKTLKMEKYFPLREKILLKKILKENVNIYKDFGMNLLQWTFVKMNFY